jgi:hypothetical protein
MKKNISEEALYARMRNLANIGHVSIKESHTRNIGTLIDYKRAINGVAYGIIKENHHYYIKKGGINESLSAADFTYIGGLSNITEYQYSKLSEAEKQLPLVLQTISEGYATKISKNGGKLNEDAAGEEIDMATDKLSDLDTATDAANASTIEPEGDDEMNAGLDAMPTDDTAPEEDIDLPVGDEEISVDNEEAPEGDVNLPDDNQESDVNKEIEKNLGKLTNTLRKTELTDSQTKSYVNTFLSAFKDKFPDIEIEDRKKMAEKITKVVPPEDIEDLGTNVEDTESTPVEEGECSECGGFAQYAESRGYNGQSIQECDDEEMTNLISGYANSKEDDDNEIGEHDFKAIALFITPEIIEKLKGDYGHDDLANNVQPFSTEMNEEDKSMQIAELFGGLKNAFNKVGSDVKNVAQKGAQAVNQYAQGVKQSYHAGEVPAEVKKLEGIAANLGQQINSLNQRLQKAGKQPVNTSSILTTIKNQIVAGKTANIGKYANEGEMPIDNTQVQSVEEDVNIDSFNVDDEEGSTEETPNISGGFQSLGGGVVKPDGAQTTTVEVTKGAVNVTMNESEIKLRKYIHNRLKEHAGIRKPSLNEVAKSSTLKKLDKMIDEQFKNHKPNVDEGLGDFLGKVGRNIGSTMGIDAAIQPKIKADLPKYIQSNDLNGIDKLFKTAFPSISGAVKQRIPNMSVNQKANLLNQAANDPDGIGNVGIKRSEVGFEPIYIPANKAGLSAGYQVAEQFPKVDEGLGDMINKMGRNIGSSMGLDVAIQPKIKADLPKYVQNNDLNGIDKLFKTAFPSISGGVKQRIANISGSQKVGLLNQAANDPDGIGNVGVKRSEVGFEPTYIPANKAGLSAGYQVAERKNNV